MAHKKSAKSNVSASAVYTDCIRDSITKFFFAGEASIPKEEGENWKDMKGFANHLTVE